MNKLFYIFVLLLMLSSQLTFSQTFPRIAEIKDPSGLEFGFGNMISGVDFDQDGLPEIYAVNANINDRPYELIARIYKFEWNPNTATWDSVWGAIADLPQQNTYPALTWGDIDQDGKPEIYWGPSNFLDAVINPNPYRIFVYEYPGDGSDNMGVDDGFGGFEPNAKTKITNQDMFSIAPINFIISDVDDDGDQEIIFANQAAGSSNFHVGVISVDDIPDLGGGTETWTVEYSGIGDPNLAGTGNKWDFVVVGNEIGLFNASGTTSLVKYESGNWISFPAQTTVAGGFSSFKGSILVTFPDNSSSVIVGSWLSSKVYLIDKDENADTLVSYEIADFAPHALRLNGSGVGDVDGDGLPDMIFGSRYSAANGSTIPVFRLEYQSGDPKSPSSYIASVIDSAYWNNNGDMGVISVANVDGDDADEVLYTTQYPRSNPDLGYMPIILLDLEFTPVSIYEENYSVPVKYSLDQNYPNPFNPVTLIRYQIPEASNVTLKIYDILGNEIISLINEYQAAGHYQLEFDASNISTGIYFYQLNAGSYSQTRKMAFIK